VSLRRARPSPSRRLDKHYHIRKTLSSTLFVSHKFEGISEEEEEEEEENYLLAAITDTTIGRSDAVSRGWASERVGRRRYSTGGTSCRRRRRLGKDPSPTDRAAEPVRRWP
jgi:hypothetical protein